MTDPVPEGQQNPTEPGEVTIDTSKKQTCYLSISCATILDNMENLTEGKEDLVPSDGVIYAQREVSFYEGESVFDVLLRETQNNRIHMEYSFTQCIIQITLKVFIIYMNLTVAVIRVGCML